jgi:c-di-GMP-related signal transduction protein
MGYPIRPNPKYPSFAINGNCTAQAQHNTTDNASVDVFVARQAIFDRDLKIFGYELLFRSRQSEAFDGSDEASSTLQVITNSFLSIGSERILGGGKAFINFPAALLIDERMELLPQKTTVVEILETVKPEPEVIAACRRLKKPWLHSRAR